MVSVRTVAHELVRGGGCAAAREQARVGSLGHWQQVPRTQDGRDVGCASAGWKMEEGGGEGNVWEANLFLCVLRLVNFQMTLRSNGKRAFSRLTTTQARLPFDHHLTCGLSGKRGP